MEPGEEDRSVGTENSTVAGTPTGAAAAPGGAGAPPATAAAAPSGQGGAAAQITGRETGANVDEMDGGASPTRVQAATAGEAPTSMGGKMLHGILDALGGRNQVQYQRDPETGKMIATAVRSGPGTQWKKIIGGFLVGAAAGAGVKPGPGHMGRAAAAGFGASYNVNEKNDEQKYNRANQDFEVQQKALAQKAAIAHLTADTSKTVFENQRMGIDMAQHTAQMENDFQQRISAGGPGTQDLGVAKDFSEVLGMHKEMGSKLTQAQANGLILAIPHVGEDGKVQGMHYAMVTPAYLDQKTGEDQQFYHLTTKPGKNGRPELTVQQQTVKAGTMTNREFETYRQGADKEMVEFARSKSYRNDQGGEGAAGTSGRLNYREEARLDKSYEYNNNEVNKLGQPIQAVAGRMANLNATIGQGTPQADALIAPELLSIMAGGQGSGLRMNEAEIARIVGGRSKWQDLKADIQKWSTDPKTANSITDDQRHQIKKLADAVNGRVMQEVTVLNWARTGLIDSQDVMGHRRIVAKTNDYLNQISAGTFDEKVLQNGEQKPAAPAKVTTPAKADPNTHVFSKAAWMKANPKGDINAAVKAAQDAKYTVTE